MRTLYRAMELVEPEAAKVDAATKNRAIAHRKAATDSRPHLWNIAEIVVQIVSRSKS
jgi:hypothetical protein